MENVFLWSPESFSPAISAYVCEFSWPISYLKPLTAVSSQSLSGPSMLFLHPPCMIQTRATHVKLVLVLRGFKRCATLCRAVRDILSAQSTALRGSILPELQKHGVSIASHSQLTAPQQDSLRDYFCQELEPLLTPLAVDPGHPFPFIKHLSLNIAVLLRDPIDDAHQFAIVTVPSNIPRWKALPNADRTQAGAVIPLDEIVVSNLDRLFGGMEILSAHPFRATRTMLVLDDLKKGEEDHCAADEQADLAAIIAQEMHERKFSPFVRLEVDRSMPLEMVARLAGEMDLDLEQVGIRSVLFPCFSCSDFVGYGAAQNSATGLLGNSGPLARVAAAKHVVSSTFPVTGV